MNFCQEGVDSWGLPPWCVGAEFTSTFWVQGMLELICLVLIFIVSYRLFRAFNRRKARKRKEREHLSKWDY